MRTASAILLLVCAASAQETARVPLGVFEAHADVGETPKKGSVEYDAAAGEYRVTGGGANIWSTTDAFHFVWIKVSGDMSLAANIQFIGTGAVAHRKAVLMIRQGLEPGAPYADAALHGDGLTSLQFRTERDRETQEVKAAVTAPQRIRIERRANQFTMYTGNSGEELKASGSATVALQDPVYVGIGVCSHDAGVLETAVFSNVKIELAPSH
jgi:TolB protein